MKSEIVALRPGTNALTKNTEGDNNREVIKEYLASGGEGIELTDKQAELLSRWEKADQLIRENVGKLNRGEIANMVKNIFKVSLNTAKMHLVNAEYVFSSSNPLNKAHKIALRIEFLERQIKKAAEDRNHKAVAALEKTLAKYIEMYPETTPVEVPKNLLFSFDIDKLMTKLTTIDDAESIIDKQLEKNRLLDSMTEDIEGEFNNE